VLFVKKRNLILGLIPMIGKIPPLEKGEGGRGDFFARTLLALTVSALFLLCLSYPAEATWLIDPKKFHASVHGQFSCQDCHEDVGQANLHPNPADMVKKRTDFFDVDQCLACHDDVLDKLEQGMHGTKKVQNPEDYRKCFRCHEPHTQTPVHEEAGRFDPSRPRYEQCGVCHEEKKALPPLSEEDESCMECHRTVGPGEEERVRSICFYCHAQEGTQAQDMTGKEVALIEPDDYDSTVHANLSCTECHPQAVRFNHGQQVLAECTMCHARHDDKVAHELHGLVTCGACHLGGASPVRDKRSKQIVWERALKLGEPSRIHDMVTQYDDKACQKCHRKGNRIGAAAMLLPPKSILCMPCHAATFSVGDTTTIVTLLVFMAGIVMMFAYVLTGSRGKKDLEAHPKSGGQVGRVAKALVLDVLLQRRLYLQSKRRWLIHSLIFYPFAFHFLWGFAGLIGSLWKPEWSWVWVVLDKNRPITAFLFDLTGIMIILGIALALVRGADRRLTQPSDLPRQDRLALILIGAIVVVGFILEGMRIAMTGYPPGSPWAFVGYGIGIFFAGLTITGAYGYVWYLHAILTGIFIAYIPFSRLAHIIIAPVVLALNAANKH
jgi:nitrate reductase gamma subunit